MSTAVSALGLPDEQAIALPEAAKHLPISEGKLRELVREGAIRSTKVGRVYYVFPSDLRASCIGALWRSA